MTTATNPCIKSVINMIELVNEIMLFLSTYFIVLAVPVSLFVEGIRRKVYARMCHRQGPPIMQPFYDIRKLWRKWKEQPRTLVFKIMPIAALIVAFVIFLFIPFGWLSFQYDFIVFVYLFILLDTFYLVGGLASQSPFAFQSCVRDLLLMIGYEIVFMVCAGIFILGSGVTSIAQYTTTFGFLQMPIAAIILLYVGHIIVRVTPYDVVDAEPEISGGLFTEYLGKNLALFEIAEFMKNLAFYMIAALFIFGREHLIWGALLVMGWYAVSKAISPRYSTFRSARTFLFVAMIAFIDVVFMV